jgi:hypothetical protein
LTKAEMAEKHIFLTIIKNCLNAPLLIRLVLRVEPGLSLVRVAQSLVFCVVFCTSLFVFFLLAIVLSVLRFTADDYLFGILDLRLMITYLVS